jgi:hypothetical protein
MGLTSEFIFLFFFGVFLFVTRPADDGLCGSPEWNRTKAQIYGPGQTYSWESSWTFGLL